MAVDSVNNTSNNAGMYALGAGAATGIGAGAYGYYSKSYLKDGEIKDSFVRKVENQILEADKDIAPDEKQMYKDSLKFYDDIKNAKDADSLKNVVKNSQFFKDFVEKTGGTVEEAVKDIDEKGFANAKSVLEDGVKPVIELRDSLFKSIINECFDESKKLKFDENKITKEAFQIVEKAVKDVNMKAAGIWGGATAAVVGLGTYLLTNNNKKA